MKNQRSVPGYIVIGTICLSVIGCVTWYFGFIRLRTNVVPVKKYNTITPTQKDTVEAFQKSVSSASDTEEIRKNGSKAEAAALSTSESLGNVVVPVDEKGQINPEQDALKHTANSTRYAEITRILVEAEDLQDSVDNILARHALYMEIQDKIPNSQRQGKLSEVEVKDILNQLLPNLIEELNALSATEQRELITQLRPLMRTVVEAPTQTIDSVDVLLKTLRAYGFEPKF